MTTRAPVFVVGMHRSGTSLCSNLLTRMGFWIGEQQDLLSANEYNEDGYWERKDIVDLNDDILGSFGFSWDSLLGFRPDTVNRPLDSQLRARLRACADRIKSASGRGRPVVKDPRFCLTYHIWREFFPDARSLFVFRNPLDVAESLRFRDGMPVRMGLALWEVYNRAAIAALGEPNLTISFDRLVANPAGEIDRLSTEFAPGCSSEKLMGLVRPMEKKAALHSLDSRQDDVLRILNRGEYDELSEFSIPLPLQHDLELIDEFRNVARSLRAVRAQRTLDAGESKPEGQKLRAAKVLTKDLQRELDRVRAENAQLRHSLKKA